MRKAGITEEFVSLLWHTRLYLGHHLQPEEFSLLRQKPLDVFLLWVSSFVSGRGGTLPQLGQCFACSCRTVAFLTTRCWWWYLLAANLWEMSLPCQHPSLRCDFCK